MNHKPQNVYYADLATLILHCTQCVCQLTRVPCHTMRVMTIFLDNISQISFFFQKQSYKYMTRSFQIIIQNSPPLNLHLYKSNFVFFTIKNKIKSQKQTKNNATTKFKGLHCYRTTKLLFALHLSEGNRKTKFFVLFSRFQKCHMYRKA